MSINYQRLAFSIPVLEYWESSKETKLAFQRGLNFMINHKHYIRNFERPEFQPIREVIGDMPLMLYSEVAYQSMLHVVCPNYTQPASESLACYSHASGELPAGIALPIESINDIDICITAIKHELIHAKQDMEGRFIVESPTVKWIEDGVVTTYDMRKVQEVCDSFDSPNDMITWSIINLPWEAEAYCLSESLESILQVANHPDDIAAITEIHRRLNDKG